MSTFWYWFAIAVGAAVLVILSYLIFPATASLEDWDDYGPTPVLTDPKSPLLPTVRPSRAIGWADGEKPSAANGLEVAAFAQGLTHPRWLYALPNGDILVAESDAPATSRTCNSVMNLFARLVMKYGGSRTVSADRISLLRDTNGDGVADETHIFIDALHSPYGMALIGDDLYVANADTVVRFPYVSGQSQITASPVLVANLPAGRNHHWTKNIIPAPGGESLFVTVGSNSNVGECGPADEVQRAAIHQLTLANGDLQEFATGLRNPNGMAIEPQTGTLWTVVNERDEVGGDLVPDYITSVRQDDFFGWPYSYFGENAQPDLDDRWPADDRVARPPDYAVGSHTASLDIAFTYNSTLPTTWRSGLVITQHGSWNRSPRSGYRVLYLPFQNGMPTGDPIVMVDGFLNEQNKARGRPVGVAIDNRGAVLIADDVGNTVWRVTSQ